ncbi:MAG: hypothetical protein JNK77_02645 [Saprospiraceae bacterium]|nr:hypothetical protein [Saprospiraceae bacterium]
MAVRSESYDTSFPALIKQALRAWWNPELLGHENSKTTEIYKQITLRRFGVLMH